MNWMSIEGAAEYLGVTRRTIERRLKRGEMSGQKQLGRWLVDVSGAQLRYDKKTFDSLTAKATEMSNENDILTQKVTELSRQADVLSHQVSDLTQQRDSADRRVTELAQQVETLTSQLQEALQGRTIVERDLEELRRDIDELKAERDYLRQALAREQAVAASVQRLLPEGSELAQTRRQSWWSRLFGRGYDSAPTEQRTSE